MLDGIASNLGDDLTSDQRNSLALLLTDRNVYLGYVIQLNELRVRALQDPSAANQAAVSDYSTTVIAPIRDGMKDRIASLVDASVDVESLKRMLPMVLAALAQSINLPLLMTILGIDPDMINSMVTELTKYFKSEMG